MDQLENPDTVALCPAGRYDDTVILGGMFGTVSQSLESKPLYKLGTKAFRKHFARQEEFLVGPEAEALWRSGVRLTLGASSPTQDLRLPR